MSVEPFWLSILSTVIVLPLLVRRLLGEVQRDLTHGGGDVFGVLFGVELRNRMKPVLGTRVRCGGKWSLL